MKIKVYTKDNCAQCTMTKNVLNDKGLEYETIEVVEGNEAYDYLMNELQLRAMPVVVVETEEGEDIFTGFRPDKIEELADLA